LGNARWAEDFAAHATLGAVYRTVGAEPGGWISDGMRSKVLDETRQVANMETKSNIKM
jgi:hypothetical protein